MLFFFSILFTKMLNVNVVVTFEHFSPLFSRFFFFLFQPICSLQREVRYSVFVTWKKNNMTILKTLDTIGYCQRPLFSFGVSQHLQTKTNMWKFELNWSSKLRDNNERKKKTCHTKLCAFGCLISRPQNLNLRSRNQIRRKLMFLENNVTSEWANDHNVLYFQSLPITRYQVRLYDINYYE